MARPVFLEKAGHLWGFLSREELILDKPMGSSSDRALALSRGLMSNRMREREVIGLLVIAGGFLLITPVLSVNRITDFMIFCIFAMSFDRMYGYMGRIKPGLDPQRVE